MLKLKRRMVRVVLRLLSALNIALTPGRVALRPVQVGKNQFMGRRRRK